MCCLWLERATGCNPRRACCLRVYNMTVLQAMQSASLRLIGRKPSTFFSSQDTFEMEIVDLANEVAKVIADQHDWQVLTKVHTLTGDGVTTSFSLPAGHSRKEERTVLLHRSLFLPTMTGSFSILVSTMRLIGLGVIAVLFVLTNGLLFRSETSQRSLQASGRSLKTNFSSYQHPRILNKPSSCTSATALSEMKTVI